jgi:hypothetical protein
MEIGKRSMVSQGLGGGRKRWIGGRTQEILKTVKLLCM